MSATLMKLYCTQNVIVRQLSCSPAMNMKLWRAERGLPRNRMSEGVLTDTPDYTFLDGRPTPLLQKQKKRMLQQQEFTQQIITNISEIDFAKERYANTIKTAEEERNNIIQDRLKPKGKALLKKKR